MKTVLTIDGTHILLSASANVNAVIAALKWAKTLRWDHRSSSPIRYAIDGEPRVNFELVPDNALAELKKLPEKAGPDANGDMGIS